MCRALLAAAFASSMPLPRILVIAVFVVVLAPRPSRADGLIVPYFGANYGGDSSTNLSDALHANRTTWGISFSFMSAGVIGVEGDFGYTSDFFGRTDLGGSNVFTAMANMVVGVPFGGQQGFGIRPYGIVGIGAVKASGDAFNNLLSVSDYHVAWDAGGGLMMFFTTHVGIRGDVRYIRSLEAVDLLPATAGLELGTGHLDFTRASVGLVFRF
jgi:outer membrane protein with beta-barrel domain